MRRILTVCILIATLVGVVLCAGVAQRRCWIWRASSMPVVNATTQHAADTPPLLTFILAGLGGVRGIAAEVLWFRLDRLQAEGRFVELVQLSRWLTLLEPYTPDVWSYSAWNMAYNVSVMMPRAEDRLRWVMSGISLLRDDGLRYSPRTARLYRELSWIYLSKIGGSLDAAHATYQWALAETMAPFVQTNGMVRVDAVEGLAAMRMDVAVMQALEKQYGPLDWRIAESHALYWATEGLPFATGEEALLLRRNVYQALLLIAQRGCFAGDMAAHVWRTRPNTAVILPAARTLCARLEDAPVNELSRVAARFLSDGIRMMARENDPATVSELYALLARVLPAGMKTPTLLDIQRGWRW